MRKEDGDYTLGGCGDKRIGRFLAGLMTVVAWMFGGYR